MFCFHVLSLCARGGKRFYSDILEEKEKCPIFQLFSVEDEKSCPNFLSPPPAPEKKTYFFGGGKKYLFFFRASGAGFFFSPPPTAPE